MMKLHRYGANTTGLETVVPEQFRCNHNYNTQDLHAWYHEPIIAFMCFLSWLLY